ncbi:LysM peptidoglycan-binding domain-containing protein [Atopobacter sp. AH10]|uniref:3D domain-containing protein n=1 Tax=Atopobacter sp. AH10 TaxID=2315861 RepID=UPI000EF1DCC9|nr:3D domain-containing protein [Atopobacter sp. AH10]RLK63350.1 LysM peptidoglycan-binding domain-containing protein [Atopobacter sp. AH10]
MMNTKMVKGLVGSLLLGALVLQVPTTADASSQSVHWTPRTSEEITKSLKKGANGKELSYTIVWGDTLSQIAEAMGVDVDHLAQINSIQNKDIIHPATVLTYNKEAHTVTVEEKDGDKATYNLPDPTQGQTEVKQSKLAPKSEEQSAKTSEADQVAPQGQEPATEAPATEKQEAKSDNKNSEAKEEVKETVSPQTNATAEEKSKPQGRVITVEATAYSRHQAGLSNMTASGVDLSKNPRVIAVDPQLIPLGSRVYIEGYGEFLAADTGGAIKGNRIDIHMESIADCQAFGRRTLQITVLN